jgi:hypothetical protein
MIDSSSSLGSSCLSLFRFSVLRDKYLHSYCTVVGAETRLNVARPCIFSLSLPPFFSALVILTIAIDPKSEPLTVSNGQIRPLLPNINIVLKIV